jgi:hypothetical protein
MATMPREARYSHWGWKWLAEPSTQPPPKKNDGWPLMRRLVAGRREHVQVQRDRTAGAVERLLERKDLVGSEARNVVCEQRRGHCRQQTENQDTGFAFHVFTGCSHIF